MRIFFTIFATIFFAFSAQAQQFQNYQSKFQFHFGLGFTAAYVSLLNGSPTDDLVQYDQITSSIRFVSGSYFPTKKWGLNLSIDIIGFTTNNGDEISHFNNYLNNTYGNRYHINTQYSLVDAGGNESIVGLGRGFLGIVYRYEKDRLFIYPQASIGINALEINNTTVTLKEFNSNLIEILEFKEKRKAENFISYHISAKAGYKLSRVLWAHGDVMFTYYRPNFTIEETRFNQTLNQMEARLEHRYNKAQPSINLQVGLTLAFGKHKNQ